MDLREGSYSLVDAPFNGRIIFVDVVEASDLPLVREDVE